MDDGLFFLNYLIDSCLFYASSRLIDDALDQWDQLLESKIRQGQEEIKE